MNLDFFGALVPFILMFGVMYFILIRPQKKQQQKVKDMLDSLAVGDSVTTIGGLHGIVDELNEEAQTVVLDCEGIYLTFERRAVSKITSKAADGVAANTEELGTNEPAVEEENLTED